LPAKINLPPKLLEHFLNRDHEFCFLERISTIAHGFDLFFRGSLSARYQLSNTRPVRLKHKFPIFPQLDTSEPM
jgi:hypothetical protein